MLIILITCSGSMKRFHSSFTVVSFLFIEFSVIHLSILILIEVMFLWYRP
jgi:hypothetical protein